MDALNFIFRAFLAFYLRHCFMVHMFCLLPVHSFFYGTHTVGLLFYSMAGRMPAAGVYGPEKRGYLHRSFFCVTILC